jgi:hypothetical protein
VLGVFGWGVIAKAKAIAVKVTTIFFLLLCIYKVLNVSILKLSIKLNTILYLFSKKNN